MHRQQLQGLFRAEPQQAAALVAFNAHPVATIHETRLAPVAEHSFLAVTGREGRAARKLSQLVLAHHDLQRDWCLDFDALPRRFGLLSGEVLRQLIELSGAALCAAHMGRLILRDDVARARRELGETLWQFALRKAPFLLGPRAYEASPERMDVTNLQQIVRDSGARALGLALADEPRSLTLRLQLKLAWDIPFAEGVGPQIKQRHARLLQKLLLQEVDPTCAALFN